MMTIEFKKGMSMETRDQARMDRLREAKDRLPYLSLRRERIVLLLHRLAKRVEYSYYAWFHPKEESAKFAPMTRQARLLAAVFRRIERGEYFELLTLTQRLEDRPRDYMGYLVANRILLRDRVGKVFTSRLEILYDVASVTYLSKNKWNNIETCQCFIWHKNAQRVYDLRYAAQRSLTSHLGPYPLKSWDLQVAARQLLLPPPGKNEEKQVWKTYLQRVICYATRYLRTRQWDRVDSESEEFFQTLERE